ncbi:MAG: hypothetical protein P1U37_15090 [Minwuia sp.]|nr:hypothetical protein [Minwuia sp.]
MRPMSAIVGAIMALSVPLAVPVSASAFELISRSEIVAISDGSLPGASLNATPRAAVADAPVIELLQPNATTHFRAPVDIHVRMRPGLGASLDMSSLEIRYVGSIFSFDITDRILEHAEVKDGEIMASNADLPSGEHEILIRVNDSWDRKGERRFSFTVEE